MPPTPDVADRKANVRMAQIEKMEVFGNCAGGENRARKRRNNRECPIQNGLNERQIGAYRIGPTPDEPASRDLNWQLAVSCVERIA